MADITIYSKKDCSNCETLKNFLDNHGVDYNPVDIEENPEAREYVAGLGFSSLPVTEVKGQQPFSGLSFDKLFDLI